MANLEQFVGAIDRINNILGRIAAWLILLMVAITFAIVVLRYGFGWGRIWLQESYVWLNGLVFLLGAPLTLLHDGHVRVDIFYRSASRKRQALVNAFGSILLLLPTMVIVFAMSLPYVEQSWRRLEASREANGLPGLFLLKTMLLIFAVLLAMQGLSLLLRSIRRYRSSQSPAA